MKFLSISLSNYIGIYNGMGLYDINIDMSKCRNKITIIRGDNGSGKSTLSKAMSLFPDPNDSFIPGKPARKEIILADNDTLYRLVFIHGIKQNGDRETTKAYITKTFNGIAAELNENGNVSSYKDILYSELGLDANFAALSQLSNDDRGLADKKPAERKRFVNSIISSLETYNSIYKTLTKRASNFKSMINAIVGKLQVLGDENVIASNLDTVENSINILQDKKDKSLVELAKNQSIIQLLDPDGTIQSSDTVTRSELNIAEVEFNKIQAVIDSLIRSNNIKTSDIQSNYKDVVDRKNGYIIQNQISRNSISTLLDQKESRANELNQKLARLRQLKDEVNYDAIVEGLKQCESQIQIIKDKLGEIGIDNISNISKDEYILALETLRDLEQNISTLKSCIDFDVLESIVSEYISSGIIPQKIDISSDMRLLEDLNNRLDSAKSELVSIQSKLSLLDTLSLRPSSCKDDTCAFIKNAIEFSNTNPNESIKTLEGIICGLENDISLTNDRINKSMKYNEAISKFTAIVRDVDRNARVLSKMPNGDMFSNKVLFFERLITGYGFEYMKTIYRYIDLSNLFDTYKNLMDMYNKYKSELRIYESKSDTLLELQSEIDSINRDVSAITDKIEPILSEVADREKDIAVLQELEGVYASILDNIEKQKPIQETISRCRGKLLDNSRKMNDINTAIAKSVELKQEINRLSLSLSPLMKERDSLNHSVQMIADYNKELSELQANYDFIETIKYYSSPTTGIQLVFMELYMGKIIALANQLLKLLFNGQFEIQPFVINDSEFRIPCLGGGYLNDDISSMSSSQIGMISMILSFALLHHSSTKYNIIKLDEIDGPLDYNNRVYFMDVLDSIMNIMGTEQCIMISHNSELQVDNSDVILLKHDESNNDYNRGNIIWKY